MKASKFNVFFEYQNLNVGYNCFSREFIILDPLLLQLFEVGLKKNDFSELEDIHSDFYHFLINKGFLVDEELDEFEHVKKLSKQVDNDDSQFHLIVNPTMNCNFKCWYCYETHVKDSKMDQTTIDATIKFINNVIENQKNLKSFHLSFFGGEPLLYFHKVIDPLLKTAFKLCKSNNIEFGSGMTTNGLLITDEIIKVSSKYGLNHFQITLDGNRERHDKVRFISEGRGSYDKIIKNIVSLVRSKLYAHVRINCSPETLDGIDEILNDFEHLNAEERQFINFDIHKVWQIEENISNEIDVTRENYKEKGFMMTSGVYDTVIHSCYGDKRYQATLNYNGDVYKCTARDFTSSSREGRLNTDGTISWNDLYEKRLDSKFKNPPCKECKILPLCGGGCSQQAVEHENVDYCIHNFDEEEKTNQVIKKFLSEIS